ncbi:MAG: DUF547 domain-containing protein [Cytophagales bacterium]|nr:DUF547 domain-containing protein [Cytophagales bacterium]MCA6365571.1 DUF547 domain-containing protein [Cytophagales bacterium]MCA6372514.1 DUF547 domain-containing protein [Cytophagales bacterium]MCA6374290.1 DUF547 domain-containing protein [Cytophagales bacterium]MCA6383207.1 DUF547 domain-containing protein [Cytophagales bacterium]
MKTSLVTLFFLATSLMSFGEDQLSAFTDSSDSFLKKYVSNGSVAYTKIKQNIGEVEALYALIGEMNLSGVDVAMQKSFYINAYNLIVIYWVAKHYPLKSPLDNSGFFDKVKHKVAGEEITLNSLEIKKLLLLYKDARLHFALACAAKSCPPLASFAYTPVALDKQLTERATAALNNPGWLKINNAEKKVELSKIFEWYKKDFTADGKTELEWINQYRKEKIPATYAVGFYEYNWALNEK